MGISRVQLQETETTQAIFSREALTREEQVFVLLGRLEGPTPGLPPPLPPGTRKVRDQVLEG